MKLLKRIYAPGPRRNNELLKKYVASVQAKEIQDQRLRMKRDY